MRNRTRITREKSPWAVICIIAVVILFGTFWFWQKQQIVSYVSPAPQPTVRTTPKPMPSVNDLEASAANIAIPSFEKVL